MCKSEEFPEPYFTVVFFYGKVGKLPVKLALQQLLLVIAPKLL